MSVLFLKLSKIHFIYRRCFDLWRYFAALSHHKHHEHKDQRFELLLFRFFQQRKHQKQWHRMMKPRAKFFTTDNLRSCSLIVKKLHSSSPAASELVWTCTFPLRFRPKFGASGKCCCGVQTRQIRSTCECLSSISVAGSSRWAAQRQELHFGAMQTTSSSARWPLASDCSSASLCQLQLRHNITTKPAPAHLASPETTARIGSGISSGGTEKENRSLVY